MESGLVTVQIATSSHLPEQSVALWLQDETRNSAAILVKFWETADEAYHFQDSLCKDLNDGRHFCSARITTAGLDELSRRESISASSIISFKELGGHESHTLNILHEYRTRRGEEGEMRRLVRKWDLLEQSLSVQEAVYAFEGRSITVLACRAKPGLQSMPSEPRFLYRILFYCHALRTEDVLVVYGLKGQTLSFLQDWGYVGLELLSGGLVLYHEQARTPPTIEDDMVTLLCERVEPSEHPQAPGAVIFTFNIQSPYTHEFDVLEGEEGEKLSLGRHSENERIRAYVDQNSKLLAEHIVRQTVSALSRYSHVVWAIQEASDEFVLEMQEKAQARRLPLRLYSQPATRDDCILVFSRERGIEVVATLDIGLDDTRAKTENYEWSNQPPLMTLSMLREELIVNLAACHLYVPNEERGKTRRTTVVQDVLHHWHLPPPPRKERNQYAEAIVVLGDFNLKENFWWQRWYDDKTSLEEPHGTAAFEKRLWVTLGEEHKLSEEDEITSPNDHIFVYARNGHDHRSLKVKDVTKKYRAAFTKEKAATDGAVAALSRAFFQRPDKRSLDETEVQTWTISDHAPLAVVIVPV